MLLFIEKQLNNMACGCKNTSNKKQVTSIKQIVKKVRPAEPIRGAVTNEDRPLSTRKRILHKRKF